MSSDAVQDVRLATDADLPALKALVESAYRGDAARGGWTHEADLLEGERITADDLAAQLANPAMRVLVLPGEDTTLPATISITDLGEGVAYLGMFAVDPALQAGGIGRRMIAAAEDWALREFSAHTMRMTVISSRAELIAWYIRRGYVDTGRTTPFPIPDITHLSMVVLEKPLG
ncbi:GNAT family N-acetyltransferase [Novosphingobium terrae]|uniref:GNAT family N-acetyltransferase n=1 Tax=Novosphingobium terrae TaxID=2726189 RepID=UPI0019806F98|nr:GNAT family N-acetyltransferase [Novosphingobium terrae]